ncbi:hypothetical protein ACXYMP_13120 [Aliiroseovarius sp. CAU 1755]
MIDAKMKLVVVTDIFGKPSLRDCLSANLTELEEVQRFSLGDLCHRAYLSGEELHHHLFTEGGITVAASALRNLICDGSFGLGYSAGGTALWQAVISGMPLAGLTCVSSTRLRNERAAPVQTHTFFGALDKGQPSTDWLTTVPNTYKVFSGLEHSFYLDHVDDKALKARSAICAAIMSMAG